MCPVGGDQRTIPGVGCDHISPTQPIHARHKTMFGRRGSIDIMPVASEPSATSGDTDDDAKESEDERDNVDPVDVNVASLDKDVLPPLLSSPPASPTKKDEERVLSLPSKRRFAHFSGKLMKAAKKGTIGDIKKALASLKEYTDNVGNDPATLMPVVDEALEVACTSDNLGPLQYLLAAAGGDVSELLGQCALPAVAIAAKHGSLSIIQYLNSVHHVDMQYRSQKDGGTLLHLISESSDSSQEKYLACCEWLLQHLDVDVTRTKDDATALHLASYTGKDLIVKHLLDSNADPSAKCQSLRDGHNYTPLDLARKGAEKRGTFSSLIGSSNAGGNYKNCIQLLGPLDNDKDAEKQQNPGRSDVQSPVESPTKRRSSFRRIGSIGRKKSTVIVSESLNVNTCGKALSNEAVPVKDNSSVASIVRSPDNLDTETAVTIIQPDQVANEGSHKVDLLANVSNAVGELVEITKKEKEQAREALKLAKKRAKMAKREAKILRKVSSSSNILEEKLRSSQSDTNIINTHNGEQELEDNILQKQTSVQSGTSVTTASSESLDHSLGDAQTDDSLARNTGNEPDSSSVFATDEDTDLSLQSRRRRRRSLSVNLVSTESESSTQEPRRAHRSRAQSDASEFRDRKRTHSRRHKILEKSNSTHSEIHLANPDENILSQSWNGGLAKQSRSEVPKSPGRTRSSSRSDKPLRRSHTTEGAVRYVASRPNSGKSAESMRSFDSSRSADSSHGNTRPSDLSSSSAQEDVGISNFSSNSKGHRQRSASSSLRMTHKEQTDIADDPKTRRRIRSISSSSRPSSGKSLGASSSLEGLNNALFESDACTFCKKVCDIQLCVQCLSVGYCSRECQKLDWGNHKMECRKLSSKALN